MDVDNANCKMRVSQCADMELLPIERPIKIDHEITGLEKLVEELHDIFSRDHVNVQDVQKLMLGYKSNPKDWKKYAKFDRFRYTRNLVDAGNGAFNIMILCWGAGHASPIHDHADSHCFMKILSGNLEEVRYDWPEHVQPEVLKKLKNKSCCDKMEDQDGCLCEEDGVYDAGDMKEIGRARLSLNDVCYINDALGLHRVENPSHADSAVSLHLYCPPFDTCRVFDSRTGKPTTVTTTFWSINGKKVKRVMEANECADSQN
ncbi:cysteine dioxygenase type 1 [Cydia pomonella]|uniref:cysteine dioxygenase type 1 n=1 Tax=Cydia pomonella TaxID=82600 RepID=UPI002ADDC8A8|nr:cysteine dioxygenase type 1 [Cydia pomonella]